MVIGWLEQALTDLGANRSWLLALSGKTELVVTGTYPLKTQPPNYQELLRACKTASAGASAKGITTGLATAGADTTVTLGAVPCFGVRIKIANSPLNFKYGAYTVQLLDNATLIAQIVVRPATNVVDFVMLGINNAAGQASIIRIAQPVVKIIDATSSQTTGDAVTVESLNDRDMGDCNL